MKLYIGGIADPGPHQLDSSLPLLLATPQLPLLPLCRTETTCIGVEVIELSAFPVWLVLKGFWGSGGEQTFSAKTRTTKWMAGPLRGNNCPSTEIARY